MMTNTNKGKGRGGARPGAGAPKKDPLQVRKRITIQLPVWMLKTIAEIAHSSKKTRSTVIMQIIERVLHTKTE
jgi:hypothetical protein